MTQIQCGVVTLEEQEVTPADINLSDCTVSSNTVGPEGSVEAVVTATNTADVAAAVEIVTTVGGTPEADLTFEITSGSSEEIVTDLPAGLFSTSGETVGYEVVSAEATEALDPIDPGPIEPTV